LHSLEKIQHALNEKFAPLEPMLTGFCLQSGGLNEERVTYVESALGVILPSAFRETIKSLNFDNLTIGPIAFCNSGDYAAQLVKLNTSIHWWGEGLRPAEWLMVANSDPYAILLRISTGAIWVMDPERGLGAAVCVAADFAAYLRGVGTVILDRNIVDDKAVLARDILSEVGGLDSDYWTYLAK
jgi:hypothetical protein